MSEAEPPDIEAFVQFLSTAQAGRVGPAHSGYRPNHLIGSYLTSGVHRYLDKEVVSPGESSMAHIWFATPEFYPNSLHVGQVLSVQEGAKVVGSAVVKKIFNQVLAKQA